MRRIVLAGLGTVSSLVLIFAYPTSHNTTAGATTGAATGSAGKASSGSAGKASSGSSGSSGRSSGSKAYTGDAVQTRWGVVQVKITVANGKITDSQALQYPNDNGHSQGINDYALPILQSEVVAAQSAQIDAVSGATVTSDGYVQSLQSALDAAHL